MDLKPQRRMWLYALLGMLTTIVVLAFARLSFGVFLPFMKVGLHLSYKQAGYLGTTTSLGYLCTIVFAGIVASRWGSKKTVLLGITLVTTGLCGLSFTLNFWTTLVFMLLLGVGTSFTYTPFISLLVSWFPTKKGLVIGLTTSGAGLGILFAGTLIPYLSFVYPATGWRMAWGLFSVIGLVVFVLTYLFIKNPPSEESAISKSEKTPTKEIYKNRRVITVGLIYGIVGVTYIVQMIFVMSYMVHSGINTKQAGQLVAINGILSIFSGPVWGVISDRLGRRTSLMITMGITAFGMLLPVLFPTLLGFTLHIILLSCTFTGVFALTQASSMDHVKPADMPVAFSYVTFYFAFGQFIGPAIAGWMIEDFGGFKSAFLFSAICLIFGLFLTFQVKNAHKQNSSSIAELKTDP